MLIARIETDDTGAWEIRQVRVPGLSSWYEWHGFVVCHYDADGVRDAVVPCDSPLEAADCVRARIDGGYY